jgi:heptosyltransferase-2
MIKHILIIKYGALGDVIRTSYVLKGLCEKYEGVSIYWLTASNAADLLRYNPYVLQIVTPKCNLSGLKEISFDLVISLDEEKEILSALADLTYAKIIGAHLTDDNRPVYTDESAEWFDMGLISRFGKKRADELKKENKREHNDILATMLDITIEEPLFFNSPLLEKRMSVIYRKGCFTIGLNSGAGSRWLSKQLDMDETVHLIGELLNFELNGRKTCIYLLGGEEERERNRELKERVTSDRCIDTGIGNTLLEFAAIIKSCDYVISSDSLALHLAISQKIRNLSFYAPTSAREIGTFGSGVKVTSLSDDYCTYRKDADNSTLTADRIIQAFRQHLKSERILP